MKEYEIHETIMEHLCKEIEQVVEGLRKNSSMSMQDLEKLDKMYHLKKSLLTCKAMEDAESEEEDGISGRRGRSRTTGRYVSRDMGSGMDAKSYADGYSQGYSEAMEQNSVHYPPRPRW